YNYKDSKLENAKNVEKCSGEVCLEIEENLLEIYANSEVHSKPELLNKRGGSRYSEVAINLVDSIYNDKNDVQVVNCKNNKAINFMADTDVIEIAARIGKNGATPIKAKFENEHIKQYMLMMKAYEKHSVNAALTGDRDEAMRALMINPLVWDYKRGYACFNEMLEAH